MPLSLLIAFSKEAFVSQETLPLPQLTFISPESEEKGRLEKSSVTLSGEAFPPGDSGDGAEADLEGGGRRRVEMAPPVPITRGGHEEERPPRETGVLFTRA